jgi:hypothetical protein
VPENNGYYSPTSSANSEWDARTTKNGLTLGKKLCLTRARPHPRNKLRLARARLQLPAPRESRRRPLLPLCPTQLRALEQAPPCLRKTFTSPMHGFGLDNINEGTPYATRSNRVDVSPKACRHTNHCSNHYDLDRFLTRHARVRDRALGPGLGSLCSQICKYRNWTSPPNTSQQRVQGPYRLQGLGHASSPIRDKP